MILRVILHFSETHSALKTLRYKDWAYGRVVGLFVVGEKGETEMGRLEPLSHKASSESTCNNIAGR